MSDTILILMATAMPEERLLEELEQAIKDYKTLPNDSNKNSLKGWCAMIGIKMVTGDNPHKMLKVMDEMERFQKGGELLTPKEN